MYKIIGANNVEYGPVSAEQLRQWIAEGRVNAQTLAQAAGETNWKPISSYPEFAAHFPGVITPPPSGAAPQMPPPLGAPLSPDAGRTRALQEVNGPAIGLIVTGALNMAASAARVVGGFVGIVTGNSAQYDQLQNFPLFQGQNQQALQALKLMSGVGGVVMGFIGIAVGLFIIFGALKMKKLESHSMATAASILAFIPCLSPCCCIGIPIGIWALVILNKAEVKSFFT